ncbi:helix-turn-helix domain-containing protein [Holdemanella porci]|uniref:helix-turn-helix domain-containing protein n=1 Tax=Holdemanella porci TaxID=2652276 RepID=UPI003F93A8A2
MNESIEIKLDEAYKQTRMTEERLSNEEIFSNVRKMKTFDEMLAKQMKDEEFKKEYEAIQPEMDVIRAIVDARTSQNLTQKELSERTGINQADISKLENGTKNPSINLLKRLAEGMGMTLKIEFVPKH